MMRVPLNAFSLMNTYQAEEGGRGGRVKKK